VGGLLAAEVFAFVTRLARPSPSSFRASAAFEHADAPLRASGCRNRRGGHDCHRRQVRHKTYGCTQAKYLQQRAATVATLRRVVRERRRCGDAMITVQKLGPPGRRSTKQTQWSSWLVSLLHWRVPPTFMAGRQPWARELCHQPCSEPSERAKRSRSTTTGRDTHKDNCFTDATKARKSADNDGRGWMKEVHG
jgi:hypothetical protein